MLGSTAPQEHVIKDMRDTSIIVLSDLHKYSGVSSFSKGYDPHFEVYYALYIEHELGDIDLPVDKLSKKQKREIEALVKAECNPAEIKSCEDAIAPLEKARLKAEHDPKGYWERRQEVFSAFAGAGHVVLNGDVFDIQCAQEPHEKIVDSVEWLKKRMDAAPETQFHFVLGNHEAFPEFVQAMQALAADEHYGKQFSFHEHFLQINDNLFVHGDEFMAPDKYRKALLPGADVKMGCKAPLRELRTELRAAYELGNGLHHAFGCMQGLPSLLTTLEKNLKASKIEGLQEALATSKHVYSGHIHEPYAAHYHEHCYYNTGAAVNSSFSHFRPLEVIMQNGKTHEVNALLASQKEKGGVHVESIINPPRYLSTDEVLAGPSAARVAGL